MRRFSPLAVFLLFGSLAASAAAQPRVIELFPFNKEGTVIDLDVRSFLFDVGGERWAAMIDTRELNLPTTMELHARAHASFLQAGMCVRFDATLDAKGKRIVEPIRKLTVFSRTPGTAFGTFDDALLEPAPLGDEPVGLGAPPRREPRSLPRCERAALGGEKFVVAQIATYRKQELVLLLPGGRLEGKLADDAEIDVVVTDKPLVLAMLRPGDKVAVDGGFEEQGRVYATKIVATLDRALGEEPPQAKRNAGPLGPPKMPVAGGGEKVAQPPGEDFAAIADDEAAAPLKPLGGKPSRARILKVN